MEKVWLKSYPTQVPQEDIDVTAYTSVLDIFLKSCAMYPQNAAFYSFGKKMTYSEWALRSRAFAVYLQKTLKLQRGDRLALMLPNILQYPIALFGALMAGLVIVNVNPLYTVRELEEQLKDSGAKAILVLENSAHIVEQALPHTVIEHVIVTGVADELGCMKRAVMHVVVRYLKRMVPSWQIAKAIRWRAIFSRSLGLEAWKFEPVPLGLQDIAFLQYTGGTTGRAKGAVLKHAQMVANVCQSIAWIGYSIDRGKEVVITALPLYHIFSLTANCLTFSALGGMNVLIADPRDTAGLVRTLQKLPFTVMTGVNTLFNALLHRSDFATLDFSHFKCTLGGGAAIQKHVADLWQQVTGVPLLEAYGLTETSPAVCINPMNLLRFNGSIGLPIPNTRIKIIDDNEHEVPLGDRGELCIQGPQVMNEYWRLPEETQKAFTKDGYVKTGDIATVDPQGFVRIVDRKKDMILVSGFNVYPNEVEEVIARHPGVLECAVIGIPDDNSGEHVKAFVVKRDPKLTAEDLVSYCKAELTAYKRPSLIEFRDHLPKTNIGKILRRSLREG